MFEILPRHQGLIQLPRPTEEILQFLPGRDWESCWWCKDGEIPSTCYSKSQTRSLPPKVFECSVTEGDKEAVAEEGTADDINPYTEE